MTSQYIRHIVNTLYIQLLTDIPMPIPMVPYAIPHPIAQFTAYVVRSFFYLFFFQMEIFNMFKNAPFKTYSNK